MNIVTPIPTAIPVITANVNTEAVRRDNQQRETIPQPSRPDASPASADSARGGDPEFTRRSPNSQSSQQPLIYDRPQIAPGLLASNQDPGQRDNGRDESAGREAAEARLQEQQETVEREEVRELQARDREVRAHEQAHAAVGGEYAGAPSYEFESGPDGRQYAVAGEVSIDISEEQDPEETLRKAETVRAAALAPAEPSPQDFRVANEAVQLAAQARSDLAEQRAEERNEDNTTPGEQEASNNLPGEQGGNNSGASIGEIFGVDGNQESPFSAAPEFDPEAITQGIGGGSRSLEEGREQAVASLANTLRQRDSEINERATRIAGFYQQVSQPRSFGLQQSA